MPMWKEWLRHDVFDAYWKQISLAPENLAKVRIPVLLGTGWFDHLLSGVLSYWDGMSEQRPARNQHLVIGPWLHDPDRLKLGELEFARDTAFENRMPQLAFFEHYLKGATPSFDFPPSRVYLTGSNTWIDLDDYPPRTAVSRRLYLHSGGRANSLSGDGTLSWTEPAEERPDSYTHDPKNPVPSFVGKMGLGFEPTAYAGVDQRSIENRSDVLVYTGEVLAAPLSVVGRVAVTLYAASDARDTDFMTKIVDVYPDGRAVHLGPLPSGVIRARLRGGMHRAELLTPGKVERYRIEMSDMGHTFLPGHRIRLEISSSAYPYIFPNPNTGNPIATDTESRTARQTVHHSRQSPSHIELPIFPAP
jgi:uncharacterized protein